MENNFEIVEQEAKSIFDRAQELVCTSDEEYSICGQFVIGAKQLIAKIKAEFSEPKRKADEAHKAITAMEGRTLEPVVGAMELASQVALGWKRQQDRLAKEEADRIERERLKAIEEERFAEAKRLEAEDKMEEAEAIIAAPIDIPRPTRYFSPVPKVKGLSTRGNWKARILNPRLVKREFCTPDQVLINMHVNKFFPKGTQTEKKTLTEDQQKQLVEEIGGVEVFFEESFAGRLNR